MLTLRIPQRSKTVEEVTVGRWSKAEGGKLKKGETIVEIEAPDAIYQIAAAADCRLLKVLAGEGTVVAVGEPVALLGQPGEDTAKALAEIAAQAAAAAPAKTVKLAVAAARVDTSPPAPAGATHNSVVRVPESAATAAPHGDPQTTRVAMPPVSAGSPVVPVLMPQAGQSMEEGTIVAWRVKEGDQIKAGDIIFDVETDKATIEVEAVDAGRVARIVVPEGQTVEVKVPVAYLADSAGAVDAFLRGEAAPAAGVPEAPTAAPHGDPQTTRVAMPPSELPAGVTPILMPQAGQSMEEGTIVAWRVKEGDRVKVGDIIFDVETDKATIEVEAVDAGRVARIVAQEGETLEVKVPVAYMAEDDAAVDAFLRSGAAQGATLAAQGATLNSVERVPEAAPGTAQGLRDTHTGGVRGTLSGDGRVKASPAARKAAAERGIDLSAVPAGSGPGGRILSTDVAIAPTGAAAPAAGKVPAKPALGEPKRTKMSGMRKAIAKNLQASKQTIPHFYIKQTVRADALLAKYKQLKAAGEFKCTINDFVVAAVAKAVAEKPSFRSQVDGTDLLEYPNANVGMAVGVEGGLVVPVIASADKLSFRDLAAQTRRIVEQARSGKIENMGQGAITITNLGMFGITEFSAIINPPEAAILAVGAAHEEAVVENGQVKAAHVMTMILSVDHRVIDGVMAAEFVNRLRELLQDPEGLLNPKL
ncbi:MAG: 2-oxo acid dehydrogenase subunit E2 [Planctomycetaceae bacterium]|nr:2-oxo acid dehydrogenase subunit E2 [Planctomycetaceae bacterium]